MTGTSKGVYLALCTYADAEGVCYPGIKKLMELAGCSKASVFRALQQLCDLGVIERENRKTAKGDPDTNLYHILLSQPEKGSLKNDTTPSQNETTGSLKNDPLIKPIEPTHFIKELPVDKRAAEDSRGQYSENSAILAQLIRKYGPGEASKRFKAMKKGEIVEPTHVEPAQPTENSKSSLYPTLGEKPGIRDVRGSQTGSNLPIYSGVPIEQGFVSTVGRIADVGR